MGVLFRIFEKCMTFGVNLSQNVWLCKTVRHPGCIILNEILYIFTIFMITHDFFQNENQKKFQKWRWAMKNMKDSYFLPLNQPDHVRHINNEEIKGKEYEEKLCCTPRRSMRSILGMLDIYFFNFSFLSKDWNYLRHLMPIKIVKIRSVGLDWWQIRHELG